MAAPLASNASPDQDIEERCGLAVDGFIRRAQSLVDAIVPALVNFTVLLFLVHDRFDDTLIGPLLKLDPSKQTVTHHGGEMRRDRPQSAFLRNIVDRGQHSWRFEILKMNYALYWSSTLGVWKCAKGLTPSLDNIFTIGNQVGYGFAANSGTLVNPSSGKGADGGVKYGKPCSDRDVVEMVIDLDRLQLSYIINGKSYGPAFRDIEPTAYRAAVNMCKVGDSVRIVHDQRE